MGEGQGEGINSDGRGEGQGEVRVCSGGNFDPVPTDELTARCYGEYARESDFIRDTLRDYPDWFHHL